MNKIELDIVALTHTATQTQNYAIVLGEKKGNRRCFEAENCNVIHSLNRECRHTIAPRNKPIERRK